VNITANRRRLAVLLAPLLVASACRGRVSDQSLAYSVPDGGDPGRGRAVIEHFDCGSCHTIPGVRGARGLVGPPLLWYSRRSFIAGELPNTPENTVRWVRAPESVEAGTAMPAAGLSEQQARDVAAYLFTLR
jgi:mono/diheme cytochrome c family protein